MERLGPVIEGGLFKGLPISAPLPDPIPEPPSPRDVRDLCLHCNSPIRFREAEWPTDMQNRWVHLQGEGVEDIRCFGIWPTKNAAPSSARVVEKRGGGFAFLGPHDHDDMCESEYVECFGYTPCRCDERLEDRTTWCESCGRLQEKCRAWRLSCCPDCMCRPSVPNTTENPF